jgi:5-methylcytosine-specific restriction endonuclease McrA
LLARTFSWKEKEEMYDAQLGMCAHCSGLFSIEEMEGDHVYPHYAGGFTHPFNGQLLCKECHKAKTHAQQDVFWNINDSLW